MAQFQPITRGYEQLGTQIASLEQRLLVDENLQVESLEQVSQIRETALIIQRTLEQIHSRVSDIEIHNQPGGEINSN